MITRLLRFQFTHPGKGATEYDEIAKQHYIKVSIHAPWEGCDRELLRTRPSARCFNSRTLGRVRLDITKEGAMEIKVSIHAPWEGCDSHVRIALV